MNIYLDSYNGITNAFNVGETERTYDNRHSDGDYGKAKQVLNVLDSQYVQKAWWENVDVRDRQIHKFLKQLPHLEQVGQETFKFNKESGLTLDIIVNMIEKEFFSTISKKKEPLKLRKHQKEFVAKAQADYLEFLLFAKCRSGKSVMTLFHIVNKGFKVSLIVSRYSSPIQSWLADSARYSYFNNIVFINLKDKNYLEQIEYWYATDKQIILWSCIQNKTTLNIPVSVDLLVYDEAHVGYNSSQWKTLRESIQCPVLYVTGTAYSLIWDFSEQNTFIYSYFEEQYDKKRGLNNSPSMNVVLAKYATKSYQSVFNDDPDALSNLLRAENKQFVDPAVAADFLNFVFNGNREVRPKDRLLFNSKRIYMTLPSVDACYAAEPILSQTRYKPLVVTGDTDKDINDIKKHIEENEYVVILTRTANVLGVTVDVDTVINCAEGSSKEFWTQFAFRGGSGDNDWTVIDFCPERALESLRELYISACEHNSNVAEYEMLDYVSINEWFNGYSQLTQDDVNRILAQDVSNAVRTVSGLVNGLNFSKLKDLEFSLQLKSSGNLPSKIVLNTNDANGKTNRVRVDEIEKAERDEIYDKIETVKSILERIPLILFHSIRNGEELNTIDSILQSDHYQPNTADDENILQQCLDLDIIDAKGLSTRIHQARIDIEHAIKDDDLLTLEKLSSSGQSHQSIPVELLNLMLTV
jgi:hypothetical protein